MPRAVCRQVAEEPGNTPDHEGASSGPKHWTVVGDGNCESERPGEPDLPPLSVLPPFCLEATHAETGLSAGAREVRPRERRRGREGRGRASETRQSEGVGHEKRDDEGKEVREEVGEEREREKAHEEKGTRRSADDRLAGVRAVARPDNRIGDAIVVRFRVYVHPTLERES